MRESLQTGSTALAVLTMLACGPAIHEARFRQVAPRAEPHAITVFQTTRPECGFEEVGMISAEKRHLFVSAQEMLDAMRARAQRMGGDALIAFQEGARLSGSGDGAGNVRIEDKLTYSATVIRFTDTACMKRP
jgi:hypothetical protein